MVDLHRFRSATRSALMLGLGATALTFVLPRFAAAQSAQTLVVDATTTPPPAESGFLRQGTNTSPSGHNIGVTSRYLTRDGKPWLAVMGEFHFSRYPRAEWEDEILKMKAGGVEIVAAYIIWIHHEEVEGRFDWTGQRDLRAFAELCAKHGMYFYPRIGPWSHAEVRNGGFPVWLVRKAGRGLRSNDSTYLAYATRFYDEIGRQLRGLLWKDGGPVIGIQLENEYNARGPGRGIEHILQLKRMALAAGLDVPLYTVTGWDNAVLPPAEVIPVFGGYPDWPWDQSIERLPPGEVYAFRFANRWAGSRDAHNPDGTSQEALERYPFLGVEYGGGIQITYHRRPVIGTDDIAAMLPVQLGSGVNLYGYYLFHGGANPKGTLTTLQESQRTGYPTDVPVVSYDFQAPLSEYGEMRESFRRIKLVHYFLNAFGGKLAPMVVRRPAALPASEMDTTVPRLSARTLGDHGFIFFNNYLRQYHMSDRSGVQVELRLPGETLRVPESPVDVPSGAYFIWPVNLAVGGALLKYSTAQLLTRLGPPPSGDSVYVFFAVPGIAPEFAFAANTVASVEAPGGATSRDSTRILVRALHPGPGVALTVHPRTGPAVRVMLLSEAEAQNLWRGDFGGAERLVLSPEEVFFESGRVHLRSVGSPEFSFEVYPALASGPTANAQLRRLGGDGVFTRYAATLPARRVRLAVDPVRAAAPVPPVPLFNAVSWRHVAIALAPSDSAFASAAVWRLRVPPRASLGSGDVLEIRYEGDVARLSSRGELLDDNFYDGLPWRIGLARFASELRRGPLELRILPLRSDAPIYLEPDYRPKDFPASGQIARLVSARLLPRYELLLTAPSAAGGAPAPDLHIGDVAVTPLGNGVYAAIRSEPLGMAVNANSLFIVNDSDVVVVDAQFTRQATLEDLAALRRITPKPVRYVINTHWHDDHMAGDQVYQDSFPGVRFVAQANTRQDLVERGRPNRDAQVRYAPAAADRIERLLGMGLGMDSTKATAAEAASLRSAVRIVRQYVAENAGYHEVWPDSLVERQATLIRGSRRIELHWFGRANTRGDLVVYLPVEGIVATGDLLGLPVPFGFGSYPTEWIAVLDSVDALGARTFVPGHGPVVHGPTPLRQLRRMLWVARERTRAAALRGDSLPQVLREVTLDDLRAEVAGSDAWTGALFDRFFRVPVVTRVYEEATRGSLR